MINQANDFGDVYSALQQKIFYILVDGFKKLRPKLVEAEDDPNKILEWRLEALAQMHGLNDKVISLVAKQTGKSKEAIQNGKLQSKQRYMQRQIRQKKLALAVANKAGDSSKAIQIRSSIRGYQSKVRKFVDDHDVLTRDRSYEQVSSATIDKVLAESDAENS